MFICKAISASDSQAVVVKKFLYQRYAIDLNWFPPKDNPSKWVVADAELPEPYFTDFFDSHAQWFAIYTKESNDIAACCRVIIPKEKKLEFEFYHEIAPKYKQKAARAEMNRLAIKNEYLQSNAAITLFVGVIEYCLEKKIDSFFIVPPMGLSEVCLKLGFARVENGVFKYFSSDPQSSSILHLDLSDKTFVEGIIRKCRDIS